MANSMFSSGKPIILVQERTITAAATVTSTAEIDLAGINSLAVQATFTWGSGGTSLKCYVQTSLDRGVTWIDIMSFAFAGASAKKVSAVSNYVAPAAALTPTDGALADNTILNGVLGDRFRVKYVSVGTYAGGTTIFINAVARN